MIRVLLADDHALIRAGFRVLLQAADDILVIGEAVNGDRAVELARSEHPDVILMDIRMPGTDGLAATRQIAADGALSATKIVILTTFETDEYVYQALRAGASGFLVKDAEPEELIRAVRVVHRGEALLSPSVTRRLIASLAGRVPAGPVSPASPGSGRSPGSTTSPGRNGPPGGSGPPGRGGSAGFRGLPGSDLARLTEREREVLCLVAQGLSNEELARRLYLSPLTAKTHVSHIMTKLAARDRAQLVVFAYESGLVVPGATG
ncbi:MAG TPA: response regulator transcription factor [Trebonia sp.]|nr:response regulator transcription factor [Trebonia sp.]